MAKTHSKLRLEDKNGTKVKKNKHRKDGKKLHNEMYLISKERNHLHNISCNSRQGNKNEESGGLGFSEIGFSPLAVSPLLS